VVRSKSDKWHHFVQQNAHGLPRKDHLRDVVVFADPRARVFDEFGAERSGGLMPMGAKVLGRHRGSWRRRKVRDGLPCEPFGNARWLFHTGLGPHLRAHRACTRDVQRIPQPTPAFEAERRGFRGDRFKRWNVRGRFALEKTLGLAGPKLSGYRKAWAIDIRDVMP
jgi:hypothetical protein